MTAPIKAPEKTLLAKGIALFFFLSVFILGDYYFLGRNITFESIFWGSILALITYHMWVTNDDDYPALYCDECGMIYNRISQFNNHKCVRK